MAKITISEPADNNHPFTMTIDGYYDLTDGKKYLTGAEKLGRSD